MKRNIIILVLCLTALSNHAQSFVDLGLPSGTFWKDKNETGGWNNYFTYEQALNQFGDRLPTKEQLQELKDKCTWIWTGSEYKVIGPNGNFIVMPAMGALYHDYDIPSMKGVGQSGTYWSVSRGRTSEGAWALCFNSEKIEISSLLDFIHYSVRLVLD